MAPAALERLLARCPQGRDDTGESVSLYLTAAGLAALPSARDAHLREWQRFLAPAIQGQAGESLFKSDTGLVVLRQGDRGLAIAPPFPVPEPQLLAGWDDAPLRQLLTTDYTVGVVLLRLGRYLVAVFRGEQSLVTKTDTRYVKGKHHAGGTSQLRFQRIREGQMRKLYDETCRVTQSRLQLYDAELEYILLGGDRLTLNGFLKVCPYLQQRQNLILNRRLNIRDPKKDTLETVAGMLRESRVWPVGAG